MDSNGSIINRKLLIVGNGFDIAHSLPTGYEHFKKYLSDLIREYEGLEKSKECITLKKIPKPTIPNIYTRNNLFADYKQERKIIYWLIDDVARKKHNIEWGKFENYLGQLRIDNVIKEWGEDDFNVHCLRDSIKDIRGFFFEWINTIDLDVAKKIEPYLSIINEKTDIALSFNYTETLESVYGMDASNICYIHGQRETDTALRKKKSMLPFGKNNSRLEIGFGSKYVRNSREVSKKGLLMGLFKETESIIYHHKDFFTRVAFSEIEEIYSLGFSFSDSDMPYINKICDGLKRKNSTKKITWFITPYGPNIFKKGREELHMRKCIWQAGFRGRVRKIK